MNSGSLLPALFAVLGLALVHVFSVRLRILAYIPRSRWLSFAGGVSVAVVFLDILPELGRSQLMIERTVGPGFTFLKNHIYLVAMLGLAVFYGVDRVVKTSRDERRGAGGEDAAGEGAFWLNISLFAAKNAIVAYLLLREPRPLLRLGLFFLAIALEFTLGDRGLHEDHKSNYDRIGRWVLVFALLAGWGVGYVTEVPRLWLAVLSGFLAGAIVLTALKEELPAERQSRFWAFALGGAGYAALLLAT